MILPILDQALIALPLIIGSYITLSLLKLPDFSIESAYLFGAVMAYVGADLGTPFTLISASVGGALVGAIVTTMNQYLKLPFLLAAIITNGLFHGITQFVLGTSLKSFHLATPLSETLLFAMIGLVLIGATAILFRSPLGYCFAIYGNNPHFFQHNPTSGRYVVYSGVMIGHACAGIGGFLFALSSGLVDLTMNYGILLLCLTALILGKTCVRTHRPQILIPLVGLVVYFCVQQTLLHVGLNLKYFNAFQALCILGALCFALRKKKVPINHLGV